MRQILLVMITVSALLGEDPKPANIPQQFVGEVASLIQEAQHQSDQRQIFELNQRLLIASICATMVFDLKTCRVNFQQGTVTGTPAVPPVASNKDTNGTVQPVPVQ